MPKRKTKAEREAEQKAALWQRICDVYSGAMGEEWLESDDGEQEQWLNLEVGEQVIRALSAMFSGERDEETKRTPHGWLFKAHSIGKFESVTSATEWLYENGVRA